ncbi:MAG TPA: LysR substrate-binding domain-containing protein, partial [Telmatospirillum sp.]|nr:LysR substrate-binding domain-containing protein [Telmatospirillum sp.]
RLQQIERDLGVQLVMRFSKGVIFTPEGEYVAREASYVLSYFQQIKKNLLRVSDGQSGTIKLGMTNAFARFTLPQFLMKYKQLYPNVDFDISTDISAAITSLLDNNKIHIGFIRGDTEKLFEKELIGVEQAYLVNKKKIELEELPNTPQITYLKDPFSYKLLDGWWHSHFPSPPLIGMHANHGDTCLEMIATGLGYGIFLSPDFISQETDLFRTPLFYKDGAPLTRNSWIIWQKEFSEIPLVRNFLDYMRGNLIGSVEKHANI